MRVEASTIEELIEKSGNLEPAMQQIDAFLQKTVPQLERKFYSAKSITGIGYGEMPSQYQTSWGVWPMIAVVPQKHAVSLYVSAWKDGMTLPELYGKKLGKISHGKSCIRFTKFENLNLEELTNLLHDAIFWLDTETHVK